MAHAEYFYTAQDVEASLEPERWDVHIAEARPREVTDPEGQTITVNDVVVRALPLQVTAAAQIRITSCSRERCGRSWLPVIPTRYRSMKMRAVLEPPYREVPRLLDVPGRRSSKCIRGGPVEIVDSSNVMR